ncbi:hypothetical protein [Adonisia turfae]|uniref:hypothetical protein n=1 Tax=Adonisia turfae TaxID=2950184 RepID=UPI0013D1F088|nr:hypothetical protein [Adonisia turfae]
MSLPSLDNPLLLLALAMIANTVIQAAMFRKLVDLGGRLVSLYKKVAEMDDDNVPDPDEMSTAIEGLREIKQDFLG